MVWNLFISDVKVRCEVTELLFYLFPAELSVLSTFFPLENAPKRLLAAGEWALLLCIMQPNMFEVLSSSVNQRQKKVSKAHVRLLFSWLIPFTSFWGPTRTLRCLVEVRNPVPVFEVVSWLVYIAFLVYGESPINSFVALYVDKGEFDILCLEFRVLLCWRRLSSFLLSLAQNGPLYPPWVTLP